MKQIESISLTSLLAGPHYEFHKEILDKIETYGAADLRIEDLYAEYKAQVELESRIVLYKRGMPYTKEMKFWDGCRDNDMRRILIGLEMLTKHPSREFSYDADILWQVVSSCRDVHKYEMTKQSVMVAALIKELENKNLDTLSQIMLGTQTFENLRYFNNEVIDCMAGRMIEFGEMEKLDRRAERRKTDKLYRSIRDMVNANSITHPSEDMMEFIDRVNGQIMQYKHVIGGMRPGGGGNESRPKEEE